MPLTPTIVYTCSVPLAQNFEHPTTGQNNVTAVCVQPTSSMIQNLSVVAGASVTDALNTIAGAISPFAPLSALMWVDRGTAVAPASQTGSIALPKSTIQGGANALPAAGGALYIVGDDYSSEAVAVPTIGKAVSFYATTALAAIVASITAAGPIVAQRMLLTGNLSVTSDSCELRNCAVFGSATVSSDLAVSSSPSVEGAFGSIAGTTTCQGLRTRGWSFAAVNASTLDAGGSTFSAAVVCTNTAVATNCSFGSTLSCAGLTATDTAFTGAVTSSVDATISNCTFGGNLTVTGTLTIDTQSYVAAQQAGRTITAGTLVVTGGLNKQASTIGYTVAAPVNLTLLPANHPPGLYSFSLSAVVRTAGVSGNAVGTLAYTAPTIGAVSGVSAGNVSVTPVGAQNAASRSLESTGATAIVLTFTPNVVVGSPVVDIYAGVYRLNYA